MSLLEVKNLTFSFGDETLYNDAAMRLFPKEHAVLVGANGVGKTTLFKILYKDLKPDNGFVEWLPFTKVGYLDQYASLDPNMTISEYLYGAYTKWFEKERKMQNLYDQLDGATVVEQERYLNWATNIQEELISAGFYAISSSISSIMNGLGLGNDILDEKIEVLSGGMRAKVILGKLLLEESDVLLLDEPTNFLDVKHIEWLIKFLNSYPKTFIVISHNEAFLRSIANTVFAIENGVINKYKGDYEHYLKERINARERNIKAFANQQKYIANTIDFINKNLVRASTTKRAQSRRKALEKLVRIENPKNEKELHFIFPYSRDTGRDVLVVNNLEIGYKTPLLCPINTKVCKGDTVVITGKNGVGKTTFLKTVLDIIPSLSGTFEWIDTADIGYFEQDNNYNGDETPYDIVSRYYEGMSKKDIITLLSQSGLNYQMSQRKLKTLSGGEKTKVRLAMTRNEKNNVLIFDEPTNHLDVNTKKALKLALLKFPGTIIIVSHEKDFYDDICNQEMSFS